MASAVRPRLRQAEDADIESVIDLLCRSLPGRVQRQHWYGLFERPWGDAGPEGRLGYLLDVGGRIVGYIGTIYARREVGGRKQVFCNQSAWCVEPEYRAMAGTLMLAVMRRQDLVVTNLTPSPAVQTICEALGFSCFARYKLVLPAFAQAATLLRSARVLTQPADLGAVLSPPHQRIRDDHARFALGHYVVATSGGYAYVVTRRGVRRGLPVSLILHCSDPAILGAHLERLKLTVLARERSLALITLPHFVSPEPRGALKLPHPSYYKGCRGANVAPAEVDYLYSEFALLPL